MLKGSTRDRELIELLDANYYHLETFLLEVEKLEKNNSQLEGIKLKSTPNNDDDSHLFYNLSRASKGESRETSLSDACFTSSS